jgi:cysteinyl-tRNA synthetase
VLVTDYCSSHSNIDDSYAKNSDKEYVSFAAESRELDALPTYPEAPFNQNTGNITQISDAKNFLYLINPESFASKSAYINALMGTTHDLLIIDAFYNGAALTAADISILKNQRERTRMVIAYMSIGEAEDYRYYWLSSWSSNPPSWIAAENPEWEGNYKVRYWDPSWQGIIFGSDSSYCGRIISAGFDGVYLDIIDAFEYFE